MSSILDRIATAVTARLNDRKAALPVETLRTQAKTARVPQGFRAVFLGPNDFPKIIAEIKYASPSQGQLCDPKKLSPAEVAREYLSQGAAALSVLTEQDFFQGSLANLRAVRAAFPNARLLLKDFVLDEYQLLEARVAGADAALLMISLLGAARVRALREFARTIGLDTLIEVHDETEMQEALAMGADLIGVNNRNLKTLEISLEISSQLIKQAKLIAPAETVFIGESGISSGRELRDFSAQGYHGFLVGTSLMRSGDPGESLRRLRMEALA